MTSPKLRFKEFGGCWENTSFQSLFTFKNGINASKEQYGSGTKFINVLDIINNPNGITYDSIIGSVQVFQKDIDKNLVNYGDVVFQRSSETREEVGQSNVYLSKEPVVFGGFVIRGSARVPYDPLFMNGLLKTDKVRDQITQLSGGSTRFNIGQDSLNKVSVFLPSKEEQTKIASFLSAVDEKISQLSQKHQLLSQYKQGMMQKLFSQQIRFKADDGSKFEEWEDKPLNEIASKRSGKNKDGSISEVLTNSATQGIIKQSDYFEREIVTESNLNGYYIVNLDDFVYNPRISVHAPVGPIKRNKKCLGVMSPLYTVFTVSEGNLVYLEYFFDSNFWHDYVKGVANSGARHDRMNITNKDFFDMPIFYPCLEEQTKIANFLSSIDQKIEVVAQQIEQAKTWKKGLLQQMFV
ncbi:hypothetical protein F925_00152 [Acinetobacter lwoffii NCTC 5866 = CIP 64.10 = NIPH 512]|nr:hypothetical protein F925_00152 [Acinetobacter lwoffii NCTC 5866 = CIP 64.10 = NIPH 512]